MLYFLIRRLVRRYRARQTLMRMQAATSAPSTIEPAPIKRPRRAGGKPAATRGPLALLAHQVRYDLKTSLRNPRARFMTFIFPVLLLVVFNGVFGSGHTSIDGVRVSLSRFYVPGIITMSLVVGSYGNLVQSITSMRESGVLKRRRATPVPAPTLIASQAVTTVVITATMTTLLLGVAKLGFGVGFAPPAIAAMACTAIVATLAFACIGYLVSGMIGSADAAMPVVQATMLPLWFISGVFIPMSSLSSGLRQVGEIFPVEHAANSLHLASISSSFGSAISVSDLLVLAAWALGAAALAAWRFSWLPSAATA
jgi:ABC-2 type transport system permease protein